MVAKGSEVGGTSSLDRWLVHGDHGAVRVGNQTGKTVSRHRGVGISQSRHGVGIGQSRGGVGNSVAGMSATSGEMLSTSSGHSGLVHGDHGAVRMAHQGGVQVEWAGVSVGNRRGMGVGHGRGMGVSSMGHSGNGMGVGSMGHRSMGNIAGMLAAASSKVVSTSSSHGGLIHRDHGAVGVAHQGGVQVEGTSVTVGNRRGMGVGHSRGMGVGRGSVGHSGMGHMAMGGGEGGEVLSTRSSYGRLVHRHNSAVRVANQPVEAWEGGGAGEEDR